jgi:hypothetical protein
VTRRPAGPDRYATTTGHVLAVAAALIVTVAIVIGTAAGPRAGLVVLGLLVGLPSAIVLVIVLLCLLFDAGRSIRRRARQRVIPHVEAEIDLDAIEDQALTRLARRLDRSPEMPHQPTPPSDGSAPIPAAWAEVIDRRRAPSPPEPTDTCRLVEVDGEQVRGDGEMTEQDQVALAEVIEAARRRYAAQHDDDAREA